MNPARNHAVAALERWRAFQQARAANAHRAAQVVVTQATTALADANAIARDAQCNRASLLSAPTLDLDRYRAVAEIEAHLWRHATQCEVALTQARDELEQAQRVHREAHAMTDVAARRRQYLDGVLEDYNEKSISDRLAELRYSLMRAPE